jgi:hypothetical protein
MRWLGGDLADLEERLPTRTVMCPWGERAALLKDEERYAAVTAARDEGFDRVIEEATSTVMEASGDESGFRRLWSTQPERARLMWGRARLKGNPLEEPHAFIDRHGVAHLTYKTALKWAQAFAGAEPETVGLYLTEWEERLKAEGWQPGQRQAHALLRQLTPAYALVRS